MRYYMIVHKPTGNHMPQFRGSQTHIQFGIISYNQFPPRLWNSLRDARSWLTSYCKGSVSHHYSTHHEYGKEYEGLDLDPGTARPRADYKIIEVQLSSNGIEL
jgi:hypothetical protein